MPARARADVRPHVRLRWSRSRAWASRVTSVFAIQPKRAPSATSVSMARMLGNTAPSVAVMLRIAGRTRSRQNSAMDVASSSYSAPSSSDPPGSLLHGARGEPLDQEPLQRDDDHDGREAREHRRPGDAPPGPLERPREGRRGHRGRPGGPGDGERVGEGELVPAEEKRQERRGGEPGGQQRNHDPPEQSEEAGPVDGRGLLRLDRDLTNEPREKPDRQRQRERGVHEDQARPRVAQIERAHQEIEGAHRRDLGKRRARDDGEKQQALARQRQPRDRVRAGHARDERQERGERGDPEAVAERPRHQALLDHDAIVLEGQSAGQERRGTAPRRPPAGQGPETPEERGRARRQRHQDRAVADRPDRASHAATVPVRRIFRYAHATAMTRRNTTTLSAEPKPSWSVWKRAR